MKKNWLQKKLTYIVLATAVVGIWISSIFLQDNQRYPAAIERQTLFNFFKPQDNLHVGLQKEILESIQVKKIENRFRIDVRNFLVKSQNQTLCEIYDNFELTFEAEGIATSGERPTMKIKSPCEVSARTNLPIPVTIPVSDIYKLSPSDTDISFQMNPKVEFSFRNLSDVWPEYWVLAKVQFNNSQSGLIIDRKEIYKLSSKPLTMEWQ